MTYVRWFEKYYTCPDCGTQWVDEWSCLCNDRCPTCDLESSPVSCVDRSRPLLSEDYEGAAKRAMGLCANFPEKAALTITAEQARDYAEARLEGR